jgi:dipeptidyl aminopeptidase/acylaminoacyl peptidase
MSLFLGRCYPAWFGIAVMLAGSDLRVTAQFIRPVTVADTITMTQVVDQGPGLHDFMHLSPDGEHFSVVIERGDVVTNERIFSLLVFRAAAVFDEPAETAAVLSSHSNDDGIADVRWLDNDDLTFLGNTPDLGRQVYTVNIQTRRVRQLTAHPTKINAYAVAPGLAHVIFTADADLTGDNERIRRQGFTISDQSLTDILMGNLVAGRLRWRDIDYEVPQETFIKELSSGKTIRVASSEPIVVIPNALFPYSENPISPNGRFAVLQGVTSTREDWRPFRSPFPSTVEGSSDMNTFVLVDLASGTVSTLIDAPSSPYLTSVVWGPDSQSVVLVNTFLPLTQRAEHNRDFITKQTVVAEVDLSKHSVIPFRGPALDASVAQGVVCAQAISWKPESNVIKLAIKRNPDNHGGTCDANEVVSYKKTAGVWHEIGVSSVESALRSTADGRISISLDQGLNSPPNLKAVDRRTERSKVFTDLNPQFRSLRFAPVTLITWTAPDGARWSGDVYSPPDPQPGSRSPLVIQTHGCSTDKFDINGFGAGAATGYAAQVLANKGIMVLQAGHCANTSEESTPVARPYYSAENAEHELLGYESAIDLLDKRGIIDRKRVGLQGHSATAWTVLYAVAHPKPGYPYAAVLSTARGDLGYFAYLATSYGRFWSHEANDGAPVGKNFSTFWRNALPFNLEHVSTPMMSQEPDGLRYLPLMWEVHEVLAMSGKPEELIVFPEGIHNLVKPWERLTSQQAAVDWFAFWLQSEEDPDPAKREQYIRWRAWRAQEQQQPRDTP